MKKLVVLLLAFTLVGCSVPKVKAPSNDSLFKIKDRVVTEKDIYDVVVNSDVGFQLVRAEAQKILLSAIVEEDEAFTKEVSAKLKEAKSFMGENFELFLKTNGYATEQEYVDAIIKDIVRLEFAVKKAMQDDYETLKDLRPREARVLQVKKDQSAKALELAKAGMSLEEIAKELELKTTSMKGELMVVSDLSTLDTIALNKLLNATENGVILEALDNAAKTESYIVEVVNLKADEIKDKAVEHFILNEKLVNEYVAKLFVANNFKVYDQDLADRIRANYPGYLK